MADPNWKAKKDPKVWRKAYKKWRSTGHGASVVRAKSAVRTAVRNGTLKKPKSCPRCGRSGVRIIFHHSAKENPHSEANELKGSFMCDLCHSKADPKRSGKAIGAAVKKTLAKKSE